MGEKRLIQVCPKCGSTNIKRDFSNTAYSFGAPLQNECQDCGFSSVMVLEMDEKELETFRKTLEDPELQVNPSDMEDE